MDINQIVILAIIILAGVILVFGTYFLMTFIKNKEQEKKVDTIFNPNNLIEEESLLNMMDEKKNLDFQDETKHENQNFINHADTVELVNNKTITDYQKQINPFDVDMTTKNNQPTIDEEKKNNKYFN